MKLATLALTALLLVPAGTALARDHHELHSLSLDGCCDGPARLGDRLDRHEANLTIQTRNDEVALMIHRRAVVLQLSDRSMKKVCRELREERDEDEDNVLAQALKSAILSAVGSMLDHGIECRLRDLRSADYRGGRLILLTNDGDELFDSVTVDGEDVMECFAPADARAFVAEFRRLKRADR